MISHSDERPDEQEPEPDPQLELDLEAGIARGEEGMADALEADRVQAWRSEAEEALEQLRAGGRPFDADDLVGIVGLPDSGTNRNNAIGAIIGGAARRGRIRKLGHRRTRRVIGHGRTLTVWIGTEEEEPEP